MTTVERVRAICKAKKIPIVRIEEDLHFGNGYLNPKKIQNVPSDRLQMISEYLDVPISELIDIESDKTKKDQPISVDPEIAEILTLLEHASGQTKKAAIAAAKAVLQTGD